MKLFGYEIIIKKITRKRAKGFSSRKWTQSETDTMLRLKNEGKSSEVIGAMLNRTAPAISARYTKIHKKDKNANIIKMAS